MRSVATVIGKGSEDGEEKESPIYWFTSHMAAMTGMERLQLRNQELPLGLLYGFRGPKSGTTVIAFPGVLT